MNESELAEIRARVPTTGDGMDRLDDWFCEHACEDAAALLAEVDRLRGLLCRVEGLMLVGSLMVGTGKL